MRFKIFKICQANTNNSTRCPNSLKPIKLLSIVCETEKNVQYKSCRLRTKILNIDLEFDHDTDLEGYFKFKLLQKWKVREIEHPTA